MWRKPESKERQALQREVCRLVETVKQKHDDLDEECESLKKAYKEYHGGAFPLTSTYPSHAFDKQDEECRFAFGYISDIRTSNHIDYSVIRDVVNCIAVSICTGFLGDDFYSAFKLDPNSFPFGLLIFNATRVVQYYNINYQMASLEASNTYPTGHTIVGIVDHIMKLTQFFGVLILGCSMMTFYTAFGDDTPEQIKEARYERVMFGYYGKAMCYLAACCQHLLMLYGGTTENCKAHVIRHASVNMASFVLIIVWVSFRFDWKDSGCDWLERENIHVGCSNQRSGFRCALDILLVVLNLSDAFIEESSRMRFGFSIFSKQNKFSGLYFIMTIATMVGGFTSGDASLTGEQFKSIARLAVLSFLLSFILSIPLFRWQEQVESTKNGLTKSQIVVTYLCQNIEIIAANIFGGALVSIPHLFEEEEFPSADSFFLDDVIVYSVASMVGSEVLKNAMISFNLNTFVRCIHLIGYYFIQSLFDQTAAMSAYENNLMKLLIYTSLPLLLHLLEKHHVREANQVANSKNLTSSTANAAIANV